MIEQIKAHFPKVVEHNCLWTSNKPKIFIYDPAESEIVEVDVEEEANFTIDNPKQKELAILAINQCVFDKQSNHKKCDFAVFDDQVFALVEIKNTYKRKHGKKKNAKDQLEATIKEFKKHIDFLNYQVLAIISWKYKPTRPAVSTQMQDALFHFRSTYNVKLVEGNQFIFS